SRLSLRIGIGVGLISMVAAGGERDRWELLLAGPPLIQMALAEHQAEPGEVVLSPESLVCTSSNATGTVRDKGYVCLSKLHEPLPLRPAESFSLADHTEQGLQLYTPGAIRSRLAAGQTSWLAELRRISVIFVSLQGLDYKRSDALNCSQEAVVVLQRVLYRLEGSFNKVSLDDKGITFVAAFGLPPLAHEDDAVPAVHAAQAMQTALLD